MNFGAYLGDPTAIGLTGKYTWKSGPEWVTAKLNNSCVNTSKVTFRSS